MEVIAQLEAARRGLYTGALGFVGHSGELCLAMAIRTLTVVGNEGHYFAGGGIVADSVAAREVEETHWKSRQLFGRSGAGATRDRPPVHTANPAKKLSNRGAPARH
jgi:anthranilate/para-aminobenzoate synthase component I